MATQIMIPNERAAQLRQIATDNGVKIPDAIGLLIEWAVEAGKVKDEIPGIVITRNGKEIDVELGTDWRKTFSLDGASLFAEDLRKSIRAAITPSKTNLFSPVDYEAIVSRHGPGIKIVDGETKSQTTLSKSIAGDVARMVSKAVE